MHNSDAQPAASEVEWMSDVQQSLQASTAAVEDVESQLVRLSAAIARGEMKGKALRTAKKKCAELRKKLDARTQSISMEKRDYFKVRTSSS